MKIHTKYHMKDEHQELEQSYKVGIVTVGRILGALQIRPKSIHASATNPNTNIELW